MNVLDYLKSKYIPVCTSIVNGIRKNCRAQIYSRDCGCYENNKCIGTARYAQMRQEKFIWINKK